MKLLMKMTMMLKILSKMMMVMIIIIGDDDDGDDDHDDHDSDQDYGGDDNGSEHTIHTTLLLHHEVDIVFDALLGQILTKHFSIILSEIDLVMQHFFFKKSCFRKTRSLFYSVRL